MGKPLGRRTRIIATLGPASSSEAQLRRLLLAGVDIVRLNFSHGTHAEHGLMLRRVRRVAKKLGLPVAILQDLAGPKMRVGLLQDDAVRLRQGATLMVVEGSEIGTAECLTVQAAGVVRRLVPGQEIRLADGLIALRVKARRREGVLCQVVTGGTVRSRQGFHVPGALPGVAVLTARDRRDLAFGLSLGVDGVALSFVRGPQDILQLRRFLDRHGARPFVVAKIERAEALANLEAILEVTSGVMVARGDLGVELGVENVPLAQKRIVAACRRARKPVITATQMLESMIEQPQPTRAEVSDVANAVLEGADALMLSAETAIGSHAVAAVAVLGRIAQRVEQEGTLAPEDALPLEIEDPTLAVARAARMAARAVRAAAVLAFTDTGRTARLVSSQRPRRPIFGFTSRLDTWRRMKFFWGITPVLIGRLRSTEAAVAVAEELLLRKGLVRRGDQVVVVCGEGIASGSTNTVKIHTLGAAQRAQARK
ncbi:MAG: pyruvate kinase [Planctomycetota bacterium]